MSHIHRFIGTHESLVELSQQSFRSSLSENKGTKLENLEFSQDELYLYRTFLKSRYGNNVSFTERELAEQLSDGKSQDLNEFILFLQNLIDKSKVHDGKVTLFLKNSGLTINRVAEIRDRFKQEAERAEEILRAKTISDIFVQLRAQIQLIAQDVDLIDNEEDTPSKLLAPIVCFPIQRANNEVFFPIQLQSKKTGRIRTITILGDTKKMKHGKPFFLTDTDKGTDIADTLDALGSIIGRLDYNPFERWETQIRSLAIALQRIQTKRHACQQQMNLCKQTLKNRVMKREKLDKTRLHEIMQEFLEEILPKIKEFLVFFEETKDIPEDILRDFCRVLLIGMIDEPVLQQATEELKKQFKELPETERNNPRIWERIRGNTLQEVLGRSKEERASILQQYKNEKRKHLPTLAHILDLFSEQGLVRAEQAFLKPYIDRYSQYFFKGSPLYDIKWGMVEANERGDNISITIPSEEYGIFFEKTGNNPAKINSRNHTSYNLTREEVIQWRAHYEDKKQRGKFHFPEKTDFKTFLYFYFKYILTAKETTRQQIKGELIPGSKILLQAINNMTFTKDSN